MGSGRYLRDGYKRIKQSLSASPSTSGKCKADEGDTPRRRSRSSASPRPSACGPARAEDAPTAAHGPLIVVGGSAKHHDPWENPLDFSDKVLISTMAEAFAYCDPGCCGHVVRGEARLRKLAAALQLGVADLPEDRMWRDLDLDGNGFATFAELVVWLEANGATLPLGIAGCGDAAEVHGIPFPPNWLGPRGDEAVSHDRRTQVLDHLALMELQQLLDITYRDAWTRDRGRANVVPSGYRLVTAWHSDNYRNWRRYHLRRHQLSQQRTTREKAHGSELRLPATHWSVVASRLGLRQEANECLLFHGTSPEHVEPICSGDFDLRLAGSNAGSLYGGGIYLSDSITKADEYVRVAGNGLCYVMVCRVAAGNVLYNDEVAPDAGAVEGIVRGSTRYHSVLGDRERCRGTFKEYVVYDADQLYVECVLAYHRVEGTRRR